MKLPALFLLSCLLSSLTGLAQKALPGHAWPGQAWPGPNGIWLQCGNELADNRTYAVFRKTAATDWQRLATVRKPASAAEIKARMLEVGKGGNPVKELTASELTYAWRHVRSNRVDSLTLFATNLPALYGCGLAFYDATAISGTVYSYKITREEGGRVLTEKMLDRVQFPGKAPDVTFELKSQQVTKAGILLEYTFANVPNLAGVNVWRSYYQRSNPEMIKPELLFSRQGNAWKLLVSDQTVSPKVAYSYFIQPYDVAGNMAPLTGQANLYNVQKNTIAPSVNRINTRSDEAQKAIRLSWQLANYADVVSIEVYRSKSYEGDYVRVASLRPNDTLFVDPYVKPIQTYFYSIVLNGMYETSVQSARVSGMLKASEKNILPVNNFTLSQQSSQVALEWDKADPHTHSYFLYRAAGYNQPLQHIRTLVSDSAHLRIIDTLPDGVDSKVYQYAIRSQNTSYSLGPLSPRQNATAYGSQRLPMPIRLEVIKLDYNRIRLVWQNQPGVQTSGYVVYRKQVDANGKELGPYQLIGKATVNQWVDSLLVVGKTYVYGVRNRGSNEQDLSSLSPETRFAVIAEPVPGVENVQVAFANNRVEMRWNNPLGISLKNIEVYRAEKGTKPIRLNQLGADAQSYADQKIQPGTTYYYFLKTVNSSGLESPLAGPAGVVAE